MIRSILLLTALVMLAGCHKGNHEEGCNPDGTCNGEALYCSGSGFCVAKPPAPAKNVRCNFESECFCATCAERCATGVERCEYSDTTVWGSNPSVCVCREKAPEVER